MSSSNNFNRRELMQGAGLAATALLAACSASDATQPAQSQAAEAPQSSQGKPQAESKTAPDLSGLSILITGCSSGFGRLGAEYYARCGAKVIASMRNIPRPEAGELRALAKSDGLDISVVEIDVTSDEQVNAGVAKAIKMAGKIDVLINNAGISYAGPIEVQDMKATQHIFDTNVFGPQRMARAVLPSMRQAGGGHIFNVSSQLGRLIIPGFGMYSPSKFALEAMSEQMAYELVPLGIDVTIIQPGGYPTKIWANQVPLSRDLKTRLTQEQLKAYPGMTASMGESRGSGGGDTDPMDIPRAIADAAILPKGRRPLRIPVHPGSKPQTPVNAASSKAQIDWLGQSPYGPLLKAALD